MGRWHNPQPENQKERTMGMMQEFRDFAVKGNVLDLAVGVIIGGAFGKIVDSLVKDIIMPLIGKLIGNISFTEMYIQLSPPAKPVEGAVTYESLTKAGASLLAYGNFLTIALNFLILAFVIFQMVKLVNRLKGPPPAEAPATPEDIALLREIRDSLKK
jgi:large conductance mechanosensitive channel